MEMEIVFDARRPRRSDRKFAFLGAGLLAAGIVLWALAAAAEVNAYQRGYFDAPPWWVTLLFPVSYGAMGVGGVLLPLVLASRGQGGRAGGRAGFTIALALLGSLLMLTQFLTIVGFAVALMAIGLAVDGLLRARASGSGRRIASFSLLTAVLLPGIAWWLFTWMCC